MAGLARLAPSWLCCQACGMQPACAVAASAGPVACLPVAAPPLPHARQRCLPVAAVLGAAPACLCPRSAPPTTPCAWPSSALCTSEWGCWLLPARATGYALCAGVHRRVGQLPAAPPATKRPFPTGASRCRARQPCCRPFTHTPLPLLTCTTTAPVPPAASPPTPPLPRATPTLRRSSRPCPRAATRPAATASSECTPSGRRLGEPHAPGVTCARTVTCTRNGRAERAPAACTSRVRGLRPAPRSPLLPLGPPSFAGLLRWSLCTLRVGCSDMDGKMDLTDLFPSKKSYFAYTG